MSDLFIRQADMSKTFYLGCCVSASYLAAAQACLCRKLTLTGFEIPNASAISSLLPWRNQHWVGGPISTLTSRPLKKLHNFNFEFYSCANHLIARTNGNCPSRRLTGAADGHLVCGEKILFQTRTHASGTSRFALKGRLLYERDNKRTCCTVERCMTFTHC